MMTPRQRRGAQSISSLPVEGAAKRREYWEACSSAAIRAAWPCGVSSGSSAARIWARVGPWRTGRGGLGVGGGAELIGEVTPPAGPPGANPVLGVRKSTDGAGVTVRTAAALAGVGVWRRRSPAAGSARERKNTPPTPP